MSTTRRTSPSGRPPAGTCPPQVLPPPYVHGAGRTPGCRVPGVTSALRLAATCSQSRTTIRLFKTSWKRRERFSKVENLRQVLSPWYVSKEGLYCLGEEMAVKSSSPLNMGSIGLAYLLNQGRSEWIKTIFINLRFEPWSTERWDGVKQTSIKSVPYNNLSNQRKCTCFI